MYSIGSYSILPSGAIHAVATVELANVVARPALMLGSSLLRRQNMEAMLLHGIRYAIWHDVWSNSQHDDISIVISRMVDWQALFPHRKDPNRPFADRNLFALLTVALLPLLLFPMPFNAEGKLTKLPILPNSVRHAANMARAEAKDLIFNLSKEERGRYNEFSAEYISIYIKEYERRMRYNNNLNL